ncbi:MAG TPA: Uma2 family endonuclease [Blastocatellia bacterium]|nr:Uma2 family endonuclease [Blastocatellia bacterium]HMV86303.1 Uma2 family endonuclease [Blastocatellia bacterium]HMX29827.1 Uma2 family endonuclease [Blastocatellia bacterium]HMY73901.1 Uma2 family endonuclease [Blastocatellia bacterium]HMZ19334.1 Uma2 family endonuclease [Blastocatellia bacterium]
MAVSTAEQLVEQPNVILNNVSWETYERLLEEQGEHTGTRFTYDEGTLQIMIVSFEHESSNRTLSSIVEALAEGMEVDFEPAGSTTFKRKDIKRGFEPDSSFYFRNPEAIRGKKRINLAKDPPPDLIVEIDVTHGSMDRLPIFAAVGVSEVWRYEDGTLKIYCLENNWYVENAESKLLPGIDADTLTRFVGEGQTMRRFEWLRNVRAWAKSQSNQPINQQQSENQI